VILTSRYDGAFICAYWLHRNQVRKGTNIPYISRLVAVSALVIEHGGNEDQAIVALLHDAVEDQAADHGGAKKLLRDIRKRFGGVVAKIVCDCTDAWPESKEQTKPDWQPRKEAYLKNLASKPAQSLLVSLADKTHNAEAILFDYRACGDVLWERFNGGKDGTLWYYKELADVFAQELPCLLSRRLLQAVKGFVE
jgi:(p)ppGpp synthase/HD superfamily hydrolase